MTHLTNQELNLLRAEEYRAIAEAMREPTARANFELLAEQFARAAGTVPPVERPTDAAGCRLRALECMRLARRMDRRIAPVVARVARQWLQIARQLYKGPVFSVSIQHDATGERHTLLVDENRELLDWPAALDAISPNRLRKLARGERDREREFVFLFSELQSSSRRDEKERPGARGGESDPAAK